MTNELTHPPDTCSTPAPRRRRHPSSWGYWLPAAAALAVVLYLSFFLPLPNARVIVTPIGAQ